MKEAQPLWTTWWSKAQRGMGVKPLEITPRQIVHIKLPKCSMVRFRFSAFYDHSSSKIKNVFLQSIQDERIYELTFHGNREANLRAFESIVSDAFSYPIHSDEELILTYEIDNEEGCMSGVSLSPFDVITSSSNIALGFHGVDVVSDELKGCICVFGDSIVEQGMYTKILRDRLLPYGYVVINAGIRGNRLLRQLEDVMYPQADGKMRRLHDIPLHKQCFGIAGIARFHRDVLSYHQNVCHVLIAIGINDLYQPGTFCANRTELPTLLDMKEGYESLVSFLQVYQLTYTFCAITPFYEAISKDTKKEDLRMQINAWLRQFCEHTSFIDFDDALMDEHHCLRAGFHNGDGLHPNVDGVRIMAKLLENEMRRIL